MRFLLGAVGWGVVIYALMYLLWSGLAIYGFAAGYPSLIARILVLACVTALAARSLRMPTWKDLVPYTVSWAAVAIILDAVFLVPFSGFALYTSLNVWVGYILVATLPLLTSISWIRRQA